MPTIYTNESAEEENQKLLEAKKDDYLFLQAYSVQGDLETLEKILDAVVVHLSRDYEFKNFE